jgi:hypothetical protein
VWRWLGRQLTVLVGLGLLGLGILLEGRLWLWPERTRESGLPTREQIQALAELVTLRVEVADVQEMRMAGYTGAMRAVLLVRGDFLLAVDLARARIERVDEARRSAVLVLHQPAVRSPRVDLQRTTLFEVTHEGLWLLVPGDAGRTELLNLAYAQAQRCLVTAAADPALQQRCREQTRQVVQTFCRGQGWEVEIQWEP